ncbi:hypothetical protein BDP55DRAFT_17761 [Colletotrichum godetiae]|uniref:Secreted protein n=1 Tax=Colletotrichum godetiae TaxID=1209918 RepID=A0AAJ0F5D9_9PEZI|nr:uncharacterized protein BDP55DRAFT_17761 [Colletotrichum godetiae]KAK1701327.1 hypothetical protein BDP55DRAFT_17761 [Colletotrichum godetiae]
MEGHGIPLILLSFFFSFSCGSAALRVREGPCAWAGAGDRTRLGLVWSRAPLSLSVAPLLLRVPAPHRVVRSCCESGRPIDSHSRYFGKRDANAMANMHAAAILPRCLGNLALRECERMRIIVP